jgi:cell division septum initiation protein DivIVA
MVQDGKKMGRRQGGENKMSEPKRYTAAGSGVVRTDPKGDLVLYSDYDNLLAEVKELKSQPDPLTAYLYAAELAKHDIKRLKAEVEAQAKRWAESEDLISHYKEQRDEVINDCQCARLKAEVERLRIAGSESEPRFVLLSDYRHLKAETDNLEAQVERLTKAGDAMALEIINAETTASAWLPEVVRDWNAAKEGKQP